MLTNLEQVPTYPLPFAVGKSYSVFASTPVRYLRTPIRLLKVLEKIEENGVLHRYRATLSINPNLIH
jgi:hypothetical protein